MTKIKKDVSERFFRNCLKEEIVKVTDFATLKFHDIQFIDPDFREFVYGMLHSVYIDGEIVYLYVVLRIGDELSDCFYKSIVKTAALKIQQWHANKFPDNKEKASVDVLQFKCPRKK